MSFNFQQFSFPPCLPQGHHPLAVPVTNQISQYNYPYSVPTMNNFQRPIYVNLPNNYVCNNLPVFNNYNFLYPQILYTFNPHANVQTLSAPQNNIAIQTVKNNQQLIQNGNKKKQPEKAVSSSNQSITLNSLKNLKNLNEISKDSENKTKSKIQQENKGQLKNEFQIIYHSRCGTKQKTNETKNKKYNLKQPQPSRKLEPRHASKKIKNKQYSVYRLTKQEKNLMCFSRLRQLKAQIMSGPQFQAIIPIYQGNSQDIEDWKQNKRDNLMKRRYH